MLKLADLGLRDELQAPRSYYGHHSSVRLCFGRNGIVEEYSQTTNLARYRQFGETSLSDESTDEYAHTTRHQQLNHRLLTVDVRALSRAGQMHV
ncbi:hypothetical protein D3C87_1517470 [compost metagenome]